MEHFKDLKFVIECANVRSFSSVDTATADLAAQTHLDIRRAEDAIELALDRGYIIACNDGGILGVPTYEPTSDGKMLLRRKFTVLNEAINSYSSLPVVISSAALIISVLAIIISIFTSVQ